MKINVAQQLKESMGSVRDYEVSEVVKATDDGSGSLVQGEVKLMRTDRGVLVEGALQTEVEVICSRCLSLFSCPLALNIEEEYFPITDIVSGVSVPISEEPGRFTIDEHHILDLTEAIRQCVLLVIPMKPLCDQDCAGLCPDCGHNLNQGPCNCLSQGADPRWSKLNELVSVSGILVNEPKGKE